jgi:oligopeptide transport system ATP-binding protein
MEKKEEILRVRNLDISFETTAGVVNAVRGVNLTVNRGETVAIVGESGSGKSVSAKAIMGILAKNGTIDRGQITFSYYRNPEERVTREILQMKKEEIRRHINGKRIAMVFQDPMTSLNPLMPVGKQIMEGMIWHYHTPKEEAYEKALELMKLVGITDAEKRIKNYPHQLSGGMRQRIVIAIALACDPELLICDEPTTALDVTIQSKILELIRLSISRTIWASLRRLPIMSTSCMQARSSRAARSRMYSTIRATRTHGDFSPRCQIWERTTNVFTQSRAARQTCFTR